MLKKITAMLLALTLCAGVMAGCGNSKNNDSKASSDTTGAQDEVAGPTLDGYKEPLPVASLTVDGKEIDTTDYVMFTVDDIDISFDEFRFYYFYTLNMYKQSYGLTEADLRDNQVAFNQFLYQVVETIKNELVTDKLFADNGLELDEDDWAIINDNMQNAKSNYESEDAFKEDMQRSYMTEDVYEMIFVRSQIYNKVMDTLFAHNGKYATSYDDFDKLIQDPEVYAHEIHIMVPLYSQVELDDSTAEKYDSMTLSQKIGAKGNAYSALDDDAKAAAGEKAKAVAEEALERALKGEDFEKLIDEYGWDIGFVDSMQGYYMKADNVGGYPQALLDAAFSLKEGEMYDKLVEDEVYGYFIVKRIPPDMEYINENLDAMIASHDQEAIEEKFKEVIDNMEVTYCDAWEKLTVDSIT